MLHLLRAVAETTANRCIQCYNIGVGNNYSLIGGGGPIACTRNIATKMGGGGGGWGEIRLRNYDSGDWGGHGHPGSLYYYAYV